MLGLTLLAGCAGVHQVRWTRIDGARCETTKVNAQWFSSETSTDCMVGGKDVAVATNHEDISILGYEIAAVIPIIAAGA